jgi:FkbM family methyltransferase
VADFKARLAALDRDAVCLDLGANVGDFTEVLAASGVFVHAFEPDPWTFARLSDRFAGRKRVFLHNAAVGATDGTAALRRNVQFAEDPAKYSTGSSIVFADARHDSAAIPVPVLSLRYVLGEIGPVAIVKMDIEGAEFDILDDIFADPAAYDVEAIFAETHERADPLRIAQVDAMRRAAETLAKPSVNLFWP